MHRSILITLAAFAVQCISHPHAHAYKHVAVFSVDGLHSSDVEKYIKLRPNSTIASLLKTGYEYTGIATHLSHQHKH